MAAATVRGTHSPLCGYCIYYTPTLRTTQRATIYCAAAEGRPSARLCWRNGIQHSLYSKAAQLQQQNQLQRVDLWENNPIRQQVARAGALVSCGRSPRPIAHAVHQSQINWHSLAHTKWNQIPKKVITIKKTKYEILFGVDGMGHQCMNRGRPLYCCCFPCLLLPSFARLQFDTCPEGGKSGNSRRFTLVHTVKIVRYAHASSSSSSSSSSSF